MKFTHKNKIRFSLAINSESSLLIFSGAKGVYEHTQYPVQKVPIWGKKKCANNVKIDEIAIIWFVLRIATVNEEGKVADSMADPKVCVAPMARLSKK